jgi:hypothetical protein
MSATTELWRPIAGLEGFYSVSSLGRIRSEARVTAGPAGKRYTVRERIMSPARKERGHLSVMVYAPGAARRLHVHRAVAFAFIGQAPTNLHEVAHNDGDPSNNAVENLRWSTRAENHADKVSHGTHNRGERHTLSKVSNAQVIEIRGSTMTAKEIAAAYGIHKKYASAIRAGSRRSIA